MIGFLKFVRCTLPILFSLLAIIRADAAQHDVDFTIEQLPSSSGGHEYFLRAEHNVFPSTFFEGKLISPNGTVFVGSKDFLPLGSFAGLAEKMFGTWTAMDKYDGNEITYTFEFAPFTLNDVVSETPEIISPTPGSTVPLQFDLKWKWPNGGPTPTEGISHYGILHSPNINDINNTIHTCCYTQHLEYKKTGPEPGWVEIRVGASDPIGSVRRGDLPVAGETWQTYFEFRTHSAIARYTVVPEPGTLMLITLAYGGLFAVRRR